LTANGIPFFYYGSEQGFAGGSDPGNREPIWNNFNEDHDIYKFVKTINSARAAQSVQEHDFAEKWVDDTMYAYTRGQFFVALTN